MPNKPFPWLEATEKHRIRDVDLNVGIIYNYPTLIPFVVKMWTSSTVEDPRPNSLTDRNHSSAL